MFYLSPQIQNVMELHSEAKKRIEVIDNFRKEPFWFSFMDKSRVALKHKTYSLIFSLYKNRMYRTLFYLYTHFK